MSLNMLLKGKITLKLLELRNVPYKVFDTEMTEDSVEKELVNSIKLSIQENKINALVIKKVFLMIINTFLKNLIFLYQEKELLMLS